MFQGAPPRFDHGVGELQVREGQDATQHSSGDQLVDLVVSENSIALKTRVPMVPSQRDVMPMLRADF